MLPSDFPDPSILMWSGAYYGFATQSYSPNGSPVNVQVATSPDGVHWTASGQDALPTLPSWAVAGDTWAPSVAFDASGERVRHVLHRHRGLDRLPVHRGGDRTGERPDRPLPRPSAAPVVCQNGLDTSPTLDNGDFGGSIDPDVFTDGSGNSWLLWKSDGNHVGVSSIVWSVPLSPNLQSVASTIPTELLTDDASWQAGVVEGPDMVETVVGRRGDGRLRPLLQRERRELSRLRHRVGQLPRRTVCAVHRSVHGGPAVGHLLGHVGSGRTLRRTPCRGPGNS